MREDWKKFTFLQKILVVIDLVLNPKARDYPFLYCQKVNGQDKYDFSHLKKHLIIKEFDRDERHWLWCIRWLSNSSIG